MGNYLLGCGTDLPVRQKKFLVLFASVEEGVALRESQKQLQAVETNMGRTNQRPLDSYSFSRQAALQLAFNNWSDEVGFRDEARNQEFASLVSEKETLQRWRLTDEHLTLSQPLLPMEISSPRWKSINTEWADLLPNFKGVVRTLEKTVWLDELARMCAQRFDSTYRSDMGVRKFYETKSANRKEHAREIHRCIETELMNDWKNGVRSMYEINLILAALLASCGTAIRSASKAAGTAPAWRFTWRAMEATCQSFLFRASRHSA
jgi:hypothetical protein